MKKTKLSIVIALLLVGMIVLGGCTTQQPNAESASGQEEVQDSKYPLQIVDGLGNNITIEKLPERIISIAPSQTEILYALGLGDKVVAVSDFCDYPVEVQNKEKVGSSWTTNVERVIELMPDIVFIYGEGQTEAVEQMTTAGITVVKYEPESVEEILDTITATGLITGKEEAAKDLVTAMTAKRDSIIEKVKEQERVRVFYQVWDEPLMTAGPGSFIDELIQLAGGINIAADAEGPYPQYSVEALVEKDPEVYLAPAHATDYNGLTEVDIEGIKTSIKQRPGYGQMSAIQKDRIELLEPNIVSRPGTRIIEALELIAKALHPSVF